MNELSEIEEHIKIVLSFSELNNLCFRFGLEDHTFERDNSFDLACYILDYLRETNQLELLFQHPPLQESMSKQIPAKAVKPMKLHHLIMISGEKEKVVQICRETPLVGWEEFESLGDRDFYREIIILANRRGYISAFENKWADIEPNSHFKTFLIELDTQQKINPKQTNDLLLWMQEQASLNDLAHLAFHLGKDHENYSLDTDTGVEEFVDYFEKRDRLYQVLAAKKWIVDTYN